MTDHSLLEKVRKLNWVLQQSSAGVFSFSDLSKILSELLDANVYLVDAQSRILGVYYSVEQDSSTIKDPVTGVEQFPDEYNEAFLQIEDTAVNLIGEEVKKVFKYDTNTFDKLHTVIPIRGGGERLGTMVLARYSPAFTEEDLVLGEYGAAVVGLEIQRHQNLQREEDERQRAVVQMAIGTLSYSEIEAVRKIFEELRGQEGLLVASRIADRSGITRSVIVNALRKLESAGVIESRSLGMKGTHIKVLNDKFYDELQKIQA